MKSKTCVIYNMKSTTYVIYNMKSTTCIIYNKIKRNLQHIKTYKTKYIKRNLQHENYSMADALLWYNSVSRGTKQPIRTSVYENWILNNNGDDGQDNDLHANKLSDFFIEIFKLYSWLWLWFPRPFFVKF